MKKDFYFPSKDGITEIHAIEWIPKGEIKAVLQIAHGMVEHIERYSDFAAYLAENGIYVTGHSHLGHGKSMVSKEKMGYFAAPNGNECVIGDIHELRRITREKYPKVPYFMLGHSMGSFIARLAAARHPDLQKLIVMGTGGPNPAAGAGLALIACIKRIKGERHVSDLVQKLAFGSYNKRFASEGDGRSWLTTDRAIRDIYSADRLCAFRFTVSAMGDLIRLNKMASEKRCYAATPKDMPVLLVSGVDDPVGDYGRGVKAVYDGLSAAGVPAELKLYDGARHEILNDTCRDEVYADIRSFAKK